MKNVTPQGSHRFALDDDTFNRWWKFALFKDEAAEYVHSNLQGTLEGARFVCALDYLQGQESKTLNADLIVESYILAKNLPESAARDAKTRIEAQCLYDDPAVSYLMDCLRRRNVRSVAERVANMRAAKIEELYERSASEGLEPAERLKTEQVFLQASAQVIDNATKERAMEATRRDKRSIQNAIAANSAREKDKHRLPTKEEAKQFLLMLKDAYGDDAFREIVNPLELNG